MSTQTLTQSISSATGTTTGILTGLTKLAIIKTQIAVSDYNREVNKQARAQNRRNCCDAFKAAHRDARDVTLVKGLGTQSTLDLSL